MDIQTTDSLDVLQFDDQGLLLSLSQFYRNPAKQHEVLLEELEALTELLLDVRQELDSIHTRSIARRKEGTYTFHDYLAQERTRAKHGLILRSIVAAQRILLYRMFNKE